MFSFCLVRKRYWWQSEFSLKRDKRGIVKRFRKWRKTKREIWYLQILNILRVFKVIPLFCTTHLTPTHNIATSEMAGFHAISEEKQQRSFLLFKSFLSAIMITLLGWGVVLELAPVLSWKMIILKPKLPLCHPFIIALRRDENGDPHFKWFYLLVICTQKTYFKETKKWIVEVVVLSYKWRETAFAAWHWVQGDTICLHSFARLSNLNHFT